MQMRIFLFLVKILRCMHIFDYIDSQKLITSMHF